MSKRTTTSPYAVAMRDESGWRTICYENSPKLARRAARNILKYHKCDARITLNKNVPNNMAEDIDEIFKC